MFERFTDKARKVLQLANQEAHRFNHEYVGTEHILLGMVKDKTNVAGMVLTKLGIDLRKIRLEVEKAVQCGSGDVIIGKLPMTPRTKAVIEWSIVEARKEKGNHVGTEHMLLALVHEKDGLAYQILDKLGVTEAVVREGLRKEGIQASPCDTEDDKLQDLYRLKEEAIMNQDFELASKYRDEADAYKALNKKVEPNESAEKEYTQVLAEEILRQVACVLLLHLTGKQSAEETLNEISNLI